MRKQSFKRPPIASDWTSFKPIAEAVRYIVCSSEWPISQAIVSELERSIFIPKPPFSRLEGFVWKMEYLPEIIETRALHSMLLPRSLSRLSLHRIPTRISDIDIGYTLKQVGQDIADFALNLTHLTITHLLMPDSGRIILVEADIEALLSCLPTLIKVQLSPCFLTRKVNQALSSLPKLQYIGPCVADAGGCDVFHSSDVSSTLELYAFPELREPAFVALTSLAICMPIELITALLRNTTFPAQQLIRLSARSTGSYANSTGATDSAIPNESLAHFFRAFTTRCQHVTDLFLALDSPVLPPNGDAQSIDAHTLACIAGAVQLKKLVIRDSRPLLDISEDDLIHAVRGMRDLHTLWLVPDPLWPSLTSPPTPTYTMRTAGKLLRVLPQLSSLGLYFDLRHIFTPQGNDKLPRRLAEIFCGTSPCPRTVSMVEVYEHVGVSGCLMPSTLSSWKEFGFVSMVPEHTTVVKKITDDWLAALKSTYESEQETEGTEHHEAQGK